MNGALNHGEILQLFAALAEKLRSRKVRGHIYVVVGAAMIFGFRRERTTHDVDARFEKDKEAVLAAVAEIAREQNLRPDWLNENATLFMPHGRDSGSRPVFNTPDLVVTAASGEHLLAMKLEAARQSDEDDIRTLLDSLNVQTESDAIAIHDAVFPHTPLRGQEIQILRKAMAAVHTRPGLRKNHAGNRQRGSAESTVPTGICPGRS
jgi:hypothetical protein